MIVAASGCTPSRSTKTSLPIPHPSANPRQRENPGWNNTSSTLSNTSESMRNSSAPNPAPSLKSPSVSGDRSDASLPMYLSMATKSLQASTCGHATKVVGSLAKRCADKRIASAWTKRKTPAGEDIGHVTHRTEPSASDSAAQGHRPRPTTNRPTHACTAAENGQPGASDEPCSCQRSDAERPADTAACLVIGCNSRRAC
mmetsp:Transcript_64838/g.180496  ORF Transcript_64838/g.180496 Transcript_64838/m.180496 type:complete len:200 (+) Transcript_64838:785-1384(+)